jgi:hypothetical protein
MFFSNGTAVPPDVTHTIFDDDDSDDDDSHLFKVSLQLIAPSFILFPVDSILLIVLQILLRQIFNDDSSFECFDGLVITIRS